MAIQVQFSYGTSPMPDVLGNMDRALSLSSEWAGTSSDDSSRFEFGPFNVFIEGEVPTMSSVSDSPNDSVQSGKVS